MPLRYGPTVVGVIVVSKLGVDQFDADDLRLLEVLAGHASVALVNARLYEAQRREAESAKALLELARELSSVTNLDGVLEQVALGAARIMGSEHCSVWLPTAEGGLVCRATAGGKPYAALQGAVMPAELVAPFTGHQEPFLISEDDARRIGRALGVHGAASAHAIAIVPLDHGLGALAVAVESDVGARELELLAGIASQAKLAITNAGSFATLERTFLSTVEALANALEAKDAYTSSHTRWICDMAIDVGAELGLDPERLKRRRAGRALPRHRQDRHPRGDPHEGGPVERRGAGRDRAAPGARRADPRADRAAQPGAPDRARLPRALRRPRLPRRPRTATRSRSRHGSSSPATRSTP